MIFWSILERTQNGDQWPKDSASFSQNFAIYKKYEIKKKSLNNFGYLPEVSVKIW